MAYRKSVIFAALAVLLCGGAPSFANTSARSRQPLVSHRPAAHSENRFERRLSGVWASHDTTHGAAAGAMNLKSDGDVVLAIAPIGGIETPPLTGHWHADSRRIEISIPGQGTAVMRYRISSHGLDITYPNGMRQHFYKYAKKTPPNEKTQA